MSRRGYVALAICALVVGTLSVVKFVSKDSDRPLRDTLFEETQPTLASLSYAALESESAIKSSIAAMTWVRSESVTDEQVAALARTLEHLIWILVAQHDPDIYTADRESNGYVLRSASSIDADGWPIEMSAGYAATFSDGGQFAYPKNGQLGDSFDHFWQISREIGEGANRAVAMTTASQGMLTKFARVTPASRGRPELDGEFRSRVWYGGVSSGGRRWWKPPSELQEVITRDGSALLAQSGIVLKFANGTCRPLIFTHFWEPVRAQWFLEDVTATNFPEDEPVWPVEY